MRFDHWSNRTNTIPGRTARIGNEGLATSFYNDMDEPMAPYITKVLVESGNEVPDFLEQYKPDDENNIDFDDDSGEEENDNLAGGVDNGNNGGDDDGWGSVAPAQEPAVQNNTNNWNSGTTSTWDSGVTAAW